MTLTQSLLLGFFLLFVLLLTYILWWRARGQHQYTLREGHLIEGDFATVWHEGTQSFYHATILRRATNKEAQRELDALDA